MSSTNVSLIPNNSPAVSNMFEYLYSNDIENLSKQDDPFKKMDIPFMTEKDVQKTIKTKELQGLKPIILIIYDVVYDLTDYNDHPGGKKDLKKIQWYRLYADIHRHRTQCGFPEVRYKLETVCDRTSVEKYS